MSQPAIQEKTTTLLQSMLCLVVFLVLLQVWLLNATLHAWLGGGEDAILWSAAVASVVCCIINTCFLRSLNRLR